MGCEPSGAGGRQHIVRIDVVAHGSLGGRELCSVRRVDRAAKLGDGLQYVLVVQVGNEGGIHDGTVGVGDGAVADDMVNMHAALPTQAGERRREKEEPHAALNVESLNLGEYRERRVVHHAAVVRVVERLVIAARPERPHNVIVGDAPPLAHVVEHNVIDFGRREAVVGGPLGLELLDKGVVILERHALLDQFAPLKQKAPHPQGLDRFSRALSHSLVISHGTRPAAGHVGSRRVIAGHGFRRAAAQEKPSRRDTGRAEQAI